MKPARPALHHLPVLLAPLLLAAMLATLAWHVWGSVAAGQRRVRLEGSQERFWEEAPNGVTPASVIKYGSSSRAWAAGAAAEDFPSHS